MIERRIQRFTGLQIAVHWIFALSFILAALTGTFLYLPRAFDGRLAAYAIGQAGEASRLLHRVGGTGMLFAALLYLLGSLGDLGRDLREIFGWSGDDTKWLVGASVRYYWSGDRGDLPREGRYNSGQKLAYLVQVIGFLILLATGLIMWFGLGAVSAAILQWSNLLHNVAAVFTVGFFLLHLYLTSVHPLSRESISAIFTGTVSEQYARKHHPRWYEEVRGSGGS